MINTTESGFYTSKKKPKGNPALNGAGGQQGREPGFNLVKPKEKLTTGNCKLWKDSCFTCPDELADKCKGGD